MKTYDISVPIKPDMVTWPGDPSVSLEKLSSIEDGDTANTTMLEMCVHTGTHLDAPNHFISDGKTIDQLSLQTFVGEALVMEIASKIDTITDQVLQSHQHYGQLKEISRVLLKTRNSSLWASHPSSFQKDYVGLDASAAEHLAGLGLALIGLDYLSVATYQDTRLPHEILLAQGIALLEGVNLSSIKPGIYQLICAPLLIEGCEGAPVRAFLIR